MHRGAVAEIDLDAIAHNLGIIRRLTNNRPVIAVVKADAYGHGAIEVSKRFEKEGVSHLAVAFIDEAVKLRTAGIRLPIMVLFDKRDVPLFFEYDLIPAVHDLQFAKRLSAEARKRKRSLNIHVKIDTGMGRLGFHHEDRLQDIVAIAQMDLLTVNGIMSHFSDSDVADKSFAGIQMKKFAAVRDMLIRKLEKPQSLLCHMANSAGTMTLRDAHLDAVRPGLMLYGCSPLQKSEAVGRKPRAGSGKSKIELRPAMKVRTEILSVRKVGKGTPVSYGRTFITRRESNIAVLPTGYADGFSRMFSNNAEVLIRGKRAPVVGRVCMDLTMVDVTDIKGVKAGDEVVLMGRQGREEITAMEMAAKAATIPYEILTTIGARSRRIYVFSGKPRKNQY